MTSRRDFLQQLSAATALGVVGRLPGRPGLVVGAPADLVPELDEAVLKHLAGVAIETARQGGVAFADVRIGAGQHLHLGTSYDSGGDGRPHMNVPHLELVVSYGVRVLVDGAWGFAGGHDLTAEAVAETARRAVARGRANRPRHRRTLDLAPTPVVADGRWATPIVRDPFEVPVEAQVDLQVAALAPLAGLPEVRHASVSFTWQRANRIFASSEGSLITQRTTFASLGGGVIAAGPEGQRRVTVEGLDDGQIGYEAVTRVDLAALMRRAAERAIAESKVPLPVPVSAEVGRFDLVVSAEAMAELVTTTLVPALNAERVFGYLAGRVGTSFAAPPAEVLGRYQVASLLLTLHADRSRPGGDATVGWDDEGVKPEAFPLVREGVIVDYLADRQSVAELAPLYRARGAAVRAHGCASGFGAGRPQVRLPNLTLEPGRADLSVDDLIRDTKRGVYAELIGGASDQQVLNAQFGAYVGTRLIRNGKLGPYVRDLALQFITPSFWKSLDGLGGAGAARTTRHNTEAYTMAGLMFANASVRAVPGRFRRVNVLNTGRTA